MQPGRSTEKRGEDIAGTTNIPRRRSPKQVTRTLAGVGSAAILSIYAVGYLQTRAAEAQLSGAAVPISAAPPVTAIPGATLFAGAVATPTPIPMTATPAATAAQPTAPGSSGSTGSAPTATQPPPPPPTATPTAASRYKDGTYVANGSSRHGDIGATVVIQGGRIVSARVTSCQTHYPCHYVNPLVNEVLSKQDTPTDYVSGATDSSRAYKQAVANALAQAS